MRIEPIAVASLVVGLASLWVATRKTASPPVASSPRPASLVHVPLASRESLRQTLRVADAVGRSARVFEDAETF